MSPTEKVCGRSADLPLETDKTDEVEAPASGTIRIKCEWKYVRRGHDDRGNRLTGAPEWKSEPLY